MADRDSEWNGPRWLSISGEELDLDLPQGLLAYGVVHRALDLTTPKPHKVVALKQMRLSDRERTNGMPITSIREIALLRSLRHPNIVGVLEVAVGSDMADVYMVMEYAEQDMAYLLDELHVRFTASEVKCLMKQLLEGVEYIHKHDIIHRTTTNSTITKADFGMARPYTPRPLTPDVVTVWYRPPEILLGCTRYTKSADIWSCGLIMGELILLVPLVPGNTELEQISLIIQLLGPPTDETWPKMRLLPRFSGQLMFRRQEEVGRGGGEGNIKSLDHRFKGQATREALVLMKEMVCWDPERRISARRALESRWFRVEEPRVSDVSMMPSFGEVRKGDRGRDIGVTYMGARGHSDDKSGREKEKERSGRSRDRDGDYRGGEATGEDRRGGGDYARGKGTVSTRYEDTLIDEGGGAAAAVAAAVTKRGANAVRSAGGASGGLYLILRMSMARGVDMGEAGRRRNRDFRDLTI
ncbi:kinase-like domain-containing protein [Kalaharituber pfeilii]|nr:kinase-like domain-containing protein [Kalaharituber pfeilii]